MGNSWYPGKIIKSFLGKEDCEKAIEKVKSKYPELKFTSFRCVPSVWLMGDKASVDPSGVILVNMERSDVISDEEELEYILLHEYCHIKFGHHKKDYTKLTHSERIRDEQQADLCVSEILIDHGKSIKEITRMYDKAHDFK